MKLKRALEDTSFNIIANSTFHLMQWILENHDQWDLARDVPQIVGPVMDAYRSAYLEAVQKAQDELEAEQAKPSAIDKESGT